MPATRATMNVVLHRALRRTRDSLDGDANEIVAEKFAFVTPAGGRISPPRQARRESFPR